MYDVAFWLVYRVSRVVNIIRRLDVRNRREETLRLL